MTLQEVEYRLNALIELELAKAIKAIKECHFKNEIEQIQEAIQNFEANLPEWSKALPDPHQFIMRKLKKLEQREEEQER